MWIKQIPNNYSEQRSFAFDTVFLWKSKKHPIYVMDNHLCAAWCWLRECNPSSSYNFLHIDRHSDLKGCGYPHEIEFLRKNPKISFEDYIAITYNNGDKYPFFQWDNYIRACQYLYPKWFEVNLFFTHDFNDCKDNDWGYKHFPIQTMNCVDVGYNLTQYIQEPSKYLSLIKNSWKNKWILNIDLDFFWDSEGVKIFDDEFIRDLGKRINNALDNIQVLTIALSPDCVGGANMSEKWGKAIDALYILKEEIDGLEEFIIP